MAKETNVKNNARISENKEGDKNVKSRPNRDNKTKEEAIVSSESKKPVRTTNRPKPKSNDKVLIAKSTRESKEITKPSPSKQDGNINSDSNDNVTNPINPNGKANVTKPNPIKKRPAHEKKPILISGCFEQVHIPASITSLKPHELKQVMILDFQSVGDANDNKLQYSYITGNVTNYQLAINSWLLILTDTNWCASTSFVSYWTSSICARIKEKGLFKVIAEASSVADELISNPSILSTTGVGIDIWNWYLDETHKLYVSEGKSFELFLADMLQNLRYLKRFSPVGASKLIDDAVSKFCETERGIASRDELWCQEEDFSVPYGFYLGDYFCKTKIRLPRRGLTAGTEMCIREARETMWRILSSYDTIAANDEQYSYFSSGSINDGFKDQADKLIRAGQKGPVTLGHFVVDLPEWHPGNNLTYISKMAAVPKSYKAARIIAAEEAYRNYKMQSIRHEFKRTLESSTLVTLSDQRPNQEAARIGSAIKDIATLDLSSASDSVSMLLVKKLIPPHIYDDLTKYISTHVILPLGSKKKLHKYSTSGTPLCFEVESAVFYSIVRSSTERVARWMNLDDEALQRGLNRIRIYGDDIACPAWAADHVIETLILLGFTLNTEKSHWLRDDPYRESCGVEYWNGIDISSRYYSRKNMCFPPNISLFSMGNNEHITALSMLLDLQHRLIKQKLRLASTYICDCIKALVPDMTQSHVDSVYQDIWSYYPEITKIEYDPSKYQYPIDYSIRLDAADEWVRDYQRDLEKHYSFVSTYNITNVSPKGLIRAYSTESKRNAGELLAYVNWLKAGVHQTDSTQVGPYDILFFNEPHNINSYVGIPHLQLKEMWY